MSTGLYNGVSGLALGTGLYKGTQGLWGGASGLINAFGATLNLNFLAGAPLDSRITFSRTTNAMLVDATGNLTYAPNNLVLRSEEFDNAAWAKTASTITPNAAAAPNGTTTADKLVENTAVTTGHFVLPAVAPATVAGQFFIYSVYAKAGERTFLQLIATGVGPAGANLIAGFDLTAGTAGTPSATVTSAITPAGDGWYRCSIAVPVVTTAASSLQIRLSLNSVATASSYTGDGTSGLFIWGAQFDQVTYQTLPSTYVQTVASAYYGPRFDYNPATLAPLGLLIEEQRVNLALYSAEFDNAAWTKSSTSVTANATTSPDGTTNADRLTADGLLNTHVAQQTVTYTAAAHTLTVYAKRDTNNFVQLRFGAAAIALGNGFANFDLNAGTVGTIGAGLSAASITPAGNGWYRCTITGTTLAVVSNAGFYIVTSATAASAELNTLTTSVFLYGAQTELGAFATSYIPTVASTVTRAADIASMTGTNFSSWYNQSEGTFVASYINPVVASGKFPSVYAARIQATNNSQNTSEVFSATASAQNLIRISGADQALIALGGAFTPGTIRTVAAAYQVNNFAAAYDGILGGTDTNGNVPTTLDMLNIGYNSTSDLINSRIRYINYYATRLTNAQLQALST